MAVLRKEYYTQKNGVQIIKVILKPTKLFPEGKNYFYAPREAENLVDSYTWGLGKPKSRAIVRANIKELGSQRNILFHKELFKFYRGYDWQGDIDHISLCEIDNTDQNLNAVTHQQNNYNKITKGYFYDRKRRYFRTGYVLNREKYYTLSVVFNEADVCRQEHYTEQVILRDILNENYYMFDFLKYRRGSEDILDLERTGVISEDEAIYQHVMRYSDNAWYYYRFGLEQYFKDNHIPVPKYSLDEQGFMIHPITGKKLCPFY